MSSDEIKGLQLSPEELSFVLACRKIVSSQQTTLETAVKERRIRCATDIEGFYRLCESVISYLDCFDDDGFAEAYPNMDNFRGRLMLEFEDTINFLTRDALQDVFSFANSVKVAIDTLVDQLTPAERRFKENTPKK